MKVAIILALFGCALSGPLPDSAPRYPPPSGQYNAPILVVDDGGEYGGGQSFGVSQASVSFGGSGGSGGYGGRSSIGGNSGSFGTLGSTGSAGLTLIGGGAGAGAGRPVVGRNVFVSVGGGRGRDCGPNQVSDLNGNCVAADVFRNTFIYQPPRSLQPIPPPLPNIPRRKKIINYSYVAIPDQAEQLEPFFILPDEVEQKVVVVGKRGQANRQVYRIGNNPAKPIDLTYALLGDGDSDTVLPGGVSAQQVLNAGGQTGGSFGQGVGGGQTSFGGSSSFGGQSGGVSFGGQAGGYGSGSQSAVFSSSSQSTGFSSGGQSAGYGNEY